MLLFTRARDSFHDTCCSQFIMCEIVQNKRHWFYSGNNTNIQNILACFVTQEASELQFSGDDFHISHHNIKIIPFLCTNTR